MKLAALLLLVCAGCAGATKPDPETAESIVRSQSVPVSLVDAATGESIEAEAFLAVLRTKAVVYVGERHDRPGDHGVQYAILRQLHREEPSLAVGMEMFQVPFQEPLDKWSAGEIDETVLRRDTEYDQRWGFDFSMYRPILEYARNRGIEVVALNAPKELAFAVAKDGVDELPADLASDLPELDLDNDAHRELFDAEFDIAEHAAEDSVDRYYQAQVLWDETMGSRVAETLGRADGPAKMLVFAGRVHVKRGLGIPDRAAKRGAAPYAVVLPVTKQELKAELKLPAQGRSADFFWAVEQ
ncbi:MAG: ChaN family lipoprotein [Deltaproteobacteria bacterium]|nr:ChaN family lipoprotein [Deltaproteobacteria bacterium]NND29684.1 ChaN family lipoprotein [Myxococcales bacterium]MBT8466061.1 ChaN family lipoprotein [Deltaproteobacteria bacterium]MBT8483619.1 ChaN family lipoprotein [Deltaproteobacteria bacterium]NNK09320.1 ChaN family lipoprotein [Myxococcales bacterium]